MLPYMEAKPSLALNIMLFILMFSLYLLGKGTIPRPGCIPNTVPSDISGSSFSTL